MKLQKCMDWKRFSTKDQSARPQRRAEPREIQKSGCCSVGRCTETTKFVEWPEREMVGDLAPNAKQSFHM